MPRSSCDPRVSPIRMQLKGIIDTASANVDFELGVTVPLFGYTKLTALRGNLRMGYVRVGQKGGQFTDYIKQSRRDLRYRCARTLKLRISLLICPT